MLAQGRPPPGSAPPPEQLDPVEDLNQRPGEQPNQKPQKEALIVDPELL